MERKLDTKTLAPFLVTTPDQTSTLDRVVSLCREVHHLGTVLARKNRKISALHVAVKELKGESNALGERLARLEIENKTLKSQLSRLGKK